MRHRALLLACIVFLGITSLSCFWKAQYIDLAYPPPLGVPKIAGSEGISVSVTMHDARPITGNVSTGGPIIVNQDVLDVVKSALETELSARGYGIAPGSVVVECELVTFLNRWIVHAWSGDAFGSVQMNVKIRDSGGRYIFYQMYSGEGLKTKLQVTKGEHARDVLLLALQDAVNRLMTSSDFHAAIKKAAGQG